MSRKQKKEAEKQARLLKYAEAETAFAQEMAVAADIDDPAERILKLADIGGNIAFYTRTVERSTVHNGNSIKAIFAGMAPGTAVMIGGVFLTPHLAALALVAGGISTIGGEFCGLSWSHSKDRRLTKERRAEAQDHLQKMNALRETVAATTDTLIKNEEEKICRSPLYEEILKLPGLAEAFKGAAAKRFAQLEGKNAATAQRLAAAKKRVPGDYSNLIRGLGKR